MSDVLKGVHVLVTRPEHQADNLCYLIEQQAGVAVRFPVLQIIGLDNQEAATNALNKLSNLRWLIFTSANAVNFALKANDGKIAQLVTAQIAAIGKATARELKLAGLHVDLIPKNGFDSEALLAMPQFQDVTDQLILIVKGQGGREELANVLRDRGAKVGCWEVYQRVMPDYDTSFVYPLFGQGKLDVVVVTSCEALQNLLKMIGKSYQKHLTMIPLVVISNRISRLAKEIGFKRIAVTESPSDSVILDTIIAIMNKRKNRRGTEWLN